MAYDLRGKTVLVTGASSGIGLAAAAAFARAGARVAVAARRKERLDALAEEIASKGGEALAVRCDVTDQAQVDGLFAQVRARFGGVDVLVNNAGIGLYGKVEALTPELLQQVMEVNVIAPVRCIRAALPDLKERKGQVVNVSSVLGKRALPRLGGYCASKFALEGLSESLRAEVARDGISVTVICPGFTVTEFREKRLVAGAMVEDTSALRAMGAEEVGEAIVRACRHRRREIVLTVPGKLMWRLNRASPGLFDRIAERLVGPEKPIGSAP